MASPTFVNKTFVKSTEETVTPSEPSGAAENDILIAWLIHDQGTSATAPSGWTVLNYFDSTSFNGQLAWIRRGSSAPSLTWSFQFSNFEISLTAWRGCLASGSPINASAYATPTTRNPNNPDCPAVTTTVADTTVIAFGAAWGESNPFTAPSGYTGRELNAVDNGKICVASKAVASATTENPGAFGGGNSFSDEVIEGTIALAPAAVAGVAKPALMNSMIRRRRLG